MKTMVVERELEVKGILMAEQVRLQCQMKYHDEDDGKRAIGNIYVRGIYYDGEKKKALREIVVLDVFVCKDKLDENEEFRVEIQDSKYDIQNQALLLTIELCVYGCINDEEEVVEMDFDEFDVEATTTEADSYYEYNDEPIKIVEECTDVAEEDGFDYDFIYEKDDNVKNKIVILKEKSSYDLIARKYNVNLQKLRVLNNDKLLSVGTFVVLPENES